MFMKIHYVCRGNVYRSRMAEAYTKSLGIRHEVSSSGIQAKLGLNGNIDPVTLEELNKDGIAHLVTDTWQQTTQSMLDDADVVVILSKSLRDAMEDEYVIDESKTRVWDIPDVDGVYEKIKSNVDSLINN